MAGHPENFIPWEQIEPLVRPGMTNDDVVDAVVSACRLDPARYTIVARDVPDGSTASMLDLLKRGVEIMTNDEAKRIGAIRRPRHVIA